ncbi:MAG: GHMP kinase [Verrucomicrobia bacterium]|nr:MAG: GHMP kinase [Verrucomicrobiota bacterium]
MIICKTPLRISFFGGGTDLPEFFMKNGGAVLGTAIDKHIYHFVSRFPSELFDYSIRLAYRKTECVRALDEIEHAPFRETLRHFGIERDVEIALAADLPSFSGLGSSSSFTVGLVNALSAFSGKFVPKDVLARKAIRIERDILHESVGWQDQIFAAYGGLNLIEFEKGGGFNVHRVVLPQERLRELERSIMLFFTGITRRAVEVEKNKINNIARIEDNLRRMLRLVDRAHGILTGNGPLAAFGELLHQTWLEKRQLDPAVSNPQIDDMYRRGMEAGALGGKLLGAGGGGFLAFFVPPERQEHVRAALAGHYEISFSINAAGSSIIHS